MQNSYRNKQTRPTRPSRANPEPSAPTPGDVPGGGALGRALPAWVAAESLGTALSVGAGLLFLALCMSLPLVGKAAIHGSGSPGAGPLPSLGANLAWFWGLWGATSLAAAAAIARWGLLNRCQWRNMPRHLWGLAALLLLLAVAQPAGWLAL